MSHTHPPSIINYVIKIKDPNENVVVDNNNKTVDNENNATEDTCCWMLIHEKVQEEEWLELQSNLCLESLEQAEQYKQMNVAHIPV